MMRREFITLLGGAAAWPTAARAQQPERFRRVAALMLYTETDPAGQFRASIFRQTLEKLGWTTGRNLHIDFHWGIGDGNWIRTAAANLIKLMPDVFLANGGQALEPVRQTTSTVPIIFIGGSDPVADGIVRSLANPAGNITGFTVLEPSVGAKLLGLLKEIAPGITRATILVSPGNVGAARLATSAQSVGTQFATNVSTVSISDATDIELFFNTQSNGSTVGLIVPPDPFINTHRKRIVELAAQYRVPAIYALRSATVEGGLMSYGVDLPDLFRQAAGYTDRILRGERPGDLPVQQPSKFEMIINLTTAKMLRLTVSDKLLATADEVIE